MHVPSLIERKRDGGELSEEEIRELVAGYTVGEVPDYQMAAFAMAVYFRGMSREETVALTHAMLDSGDRLEHPPAGGRIVDKHSTGGVGDKVSLILAPLLACDGLRVPMISGRGLGITGGTLDKLESIPGFQVSLTEEQAAEQLRKIGVVMLGQTSSICPADKKLYALRDVTATVPSQSLIVASIMSKKLAESLDALVLDVKHGSGAFMKTLEEAETLGEAMREVGESMGVDTAVLYNPMDEPLGRAVGNALEVAESLEVLRGAGPEDLREITLDLAVAVSDSGRDSLEAWLQDGTALEKFRELVAAQGGDVGSLDDFDAAHPAPVVRELRAPESGRVAALDANLIGRASLALGAGRNRAEDHIDPAVGFDWLAKTGDEVLVGAPVGRIHARDEAGADAAEAAFWNAYRCE